MSSATPPEVFLDRSLGRQTARVLAAAGWTVHLLADHHPGDAADVPDERWIAEGCGRGWTLLTRDRRIRFRAAELAALPARVFCVAGDGGVEAVAQRLLAAGPAIRRAVEGGGTGLWLVHAGGRADRAS